MGPASNRSRALSTPAQTRGGDVAGPAHGAALVARRPRTRPLAAAVVGATDLALDVERTRRRRHLAVVVAPVGAPVIRLTSATAVRPAAPVSSSTCRRPPATVPACGCAASTARRWSPRRRAGCTCGPPRCRRPRRRSPASPVGTPPAGRQCRRSGRTPRAPPMSPSDVSGSPLTETRKSGDAGPAHDRPLRGVDQGGSHDAAGRTFRHPPFPLDARVPQHTDVLLAAAVTVGVDGT